MKAFVLNGNESQQKLLIQANISFVELYNNATFTFMRDPINDPYEMVDKVPHNEFYQRRTDPKRVKEIARFIRVSVAKQYGGDGVATLFPTAMLIAANIEDTDFKVGDTVNIEMDLLNENSLYIVDGQHRLMGMISLYEQLKGALMRSEEDDYLLAFLQKYMFNCTILLNFDLWEQAQVFADVNFNQKKVDKSLYYTIYGMQYSTNPADSNRNYIYIAHNLVKFMNTHPLSPLRGMIMMLGNKPGYTKALMSQACLAEALMNNIYTPRGIWYVDSIQVVEKPDYRYMSVELLSFFACVRDVFRELWPFDGIHRSILLKTTGVWALNKVMAYLHKYKMDDELKVLLKETNKNEQLKEYEEFAKPYLEKLIPHQKRLFGLQKDNGAYSGTGGKGLAKQLFDEIVDIIDSEEKTNDEMIAEEKIEIVGEPVGVKFYKTSDGYYFFTLSHYFQNKDQMDPYIPGSGAIDATLEGLRFKLNHYKNQVQSDARKVENKGF